MGEKFGEIRKAAEDLRRQPGDYAKQMAFRQVILTATLNTEKVEAAIRENLGELVALIDTSRQQLDHIRAKLYNFSPEQYSAELINKNQIISAKLDADLGTLANVKTNQEQILARFEELKPTMSGLNRLVLNSANPPEAWQRAASEILLVLDHVGDGARP
jgi:hypothetical protein